MQRLDASCMSGLSLLLVYAIQAAIGVDWGLLSEWQQQESFRRWSGLVAALFLLIQWCHPLLRRVQNLHTQKLLTVAHRWLGTPMVVAFFVHASQPGVGYLALLAYTLLVGLFCGMTLPLAAPGHRVGRALLVVHVLSSVVVLAVLPIHIWAVFAYTAPV